MIILLWI